MCLTTGYIKLSNSHLNKVICISSTHHLLKEVLVLQLPTGNILTQSKLFSKHAEFVDHLFSNDILVNNAFKHLSRLRQSTYLSTKGAHDTCRLCSNRTTQITVSQITHGESSAKSCILTQVFNRTTFDVFDITSKGPTKLFNVVSTNDLGVPLKCILIHLGLGEAELIDNNVVVTSITSCFHQTKYGITGTTACFEELRQHAFTDHRCRVTVSDAFVDCSEVTSVADSSTRLNASTSYRARLSQGRCNDRVIPNSEWISF